MSIQIPPNCECAGFNPECFGVFINAPSGGLNPNEYLQYPIGQGTETLPALIDLGDMEVGNNIIMNGTEGVNYIEFPDATKQYTAYVPSGSLISKTPTTAVSINQNDYFNQANIISYPINTTKYTLNAFSGGGHCNAVVTQPSVPVNGQPYTNTVYGTSPSGSGITFRNIPIVTPQPANATYAVQIVSQPNLRNPFRNPDGGDRWSGTFSLNITGPNTITIISTDSNSSVNSIVQGTPFVVNNPPFGCPTSFIVTSILTAGSVYGICIGQGANNPAYYVNQSLLSGYGLQATAIKAQLTASMSGGVVSVSQYLTGIIEAVYEHWIYFPTSNVCYFIPNQTINNPTSFSIIGAGSGSSIAFQNAFVYYAFCGTDTYISTWQGSWQRNAILRGAVPVNTVAGGSGGSITLQQDVGTLTTQTPATNGSAGLTQTTQTYPTGLNNFTNTVVSNSLALTSSSIGIPSCANSGAWQMLFPPSNTYTATALTPAGFGGVEVLFYA